MFRSSRSQDDFIETLEARIDSLRKEINSLRKAASKRGTALYGDASESAGEVYEDLARRFTEALPHVRKGAALVERRARDNPAATAAVGLVALGLIAALVMRRSD